MFKHFLSPFRRYWNEDCSPVYVTEVVPTELRLNKSYITFYVNYLW